MISMAHPLDDFERFDVDYSDSDQTISNFKSQRSFNKPKSLATNPFDAQNVTASDPHTAPNITEHKSSFFPDSSEDDDCTKHAHPPMRLTTVSPVSNRSSMTFCASRAKTRHLPATQGERLHFGEIHFPNVKSVLWDRRVLAGPFTIVFEKLLPKFEIRTDIVSQLLLDVGHDSGLHGPIGWLQVKTLSRAGEISKLQLLASDSKLSHADCKLPVYNVKEGSGSLQATEEMYQERLQNTQKRYQTDGSQIFVNAIEAHLLIRRNSKQNATAVLEIFLPRIPLTFTMIKSLPLLCTPIVSSLMGSDGANFGSKEYHNGYVTLDQFRKAVPLLKMDPLVSKRPIVGVWIAGLVDLESTWEEISARLSVSKVLYDTCVSFFFSSLISERVTPTTSSFLVVLFPSTSTSKAANALPRFLECKYGEDYIEAIHSAAVKEITTVLSDAQICAIGIRNLAENLVFRPRADANTSSNWTQTRTSSKPLLLAPSHPSEAEDKCVPVASSRPEKLETSENPSRSKSITVINRSSTSLTSVKADRDCCQMQKRLTLQHQEILEHQQKQLHCLQDQVRQLQEIVHSPRIKEDHNVAFESELSSLELSSPCSNSDISSTNSFLDQGNAETRKLDTNAQTPTLIVPTEAETSPTDSQDTACTISPKMDAEPLSSPTHLEIPLNRLAFTTQLDTGAIKSITIPKIRSICFIDSDSDDQEMRDIERRYARKQT